MSFLSQAVIFLSAAMIAVLLSTRLGLGSVLGYMLAGVLIGPFATGLINDYTAILHVGEIGVILLLFVIGLELQPNRLWTMRRQVFGLGGLQLFGTALIIASVCYLAGLGAAASIIIGLTLATSSTPFALQILSERNKLATRSGRAGFSILLLQDMSVIPVLSVIPFIARDHNPADAMTLADGGTVIAGLLGLVFGGKLLLREILRRTAQTGINDIFTVTALLTVVGTAYLMESLSLSMGLGAFIAGVLLADSEYRHELEANIEPFKGLLMGLFFIAVGMAINFQILADQPLLVVSSVLGLLLVKGIVIYIVLRLWGLPAEGARMLTVTLGQGGEFAFIVFNAATENNILNISLTEFLILVVSLSMACTPFLVRLADIIENRLKGRSTSKPDFEIPDNDEAEVIIAGFGRVGQIIARILRARGIPFVALEPDHEQVEMARKFGALVHYGDASRLDLLRAAKADRARIFVLTTEDVESSVSIARQVTKHFPNLTIVARARNRRHVHQLMDMGVTVIQRETFLSSLDLATRTLRSLGMRRSEAEAIVETFRKHDENQLYMSHSVYQEEDKLIAHAKQATEDLTRLLADDAESEVNRN